MSKKGIEKERGDWPCWFGVTYSLPYYLEQCKFVAGKLDNSCLPQSGVLAAFAQSLLGQLELYWSHCRCPLSICYSHPIHYGNFPLLILSALKHRPVDLTGK